MSLSDELTIRNLLSEALFYAAHLDENETYENLSKETIEKCDQIFKANLRDSFLNLSAETIIIFCETALRIPSKGELSEFYMKLFFQRVGSQGQMYIRGLLLQARITSNNGYKSNLKAEELIDNCNKALAFVFKALDIISKQEDKQKYAFLIYNASICVYEIIRPLLKENWQRNFTEIVEKIDKLFDDCDEPDYNWRCRFTLMLFQCLYDNDKKPEAFKILEKLTTITKTKGDCEFQDQLLRLRIHLGKENSALAGAAKKDAETAAPEKAWKVLLLLQMMKSKLIPEATIEKELSNLINSISGSILQGQEIAGSNKLNPILQERLAEAGRVALSYNLISIADPIMNFLSRVRQLNQRAYILNEYNKAELFIRKAGPLIDSKTGMRLNSIQIKKQEVERRMEALKILDKAMITNKKLNDPELIYEGCVLIWNISLPFLNALYRGFLYNPFQSAANLLELIQSNDHALRVNLHFELAKADLQSDLVVTAEVQINKALALDYSIPLKKITTKIDEGESSSLYQRPYDRFLNSLKEKIRIRLKQNTYSEQKNEIEKVIIDLESLENNTAAKSENMRIDLLQKCFGTLVNMEERDYEIDPSLDLIEEEIKKEALKHQQNNLIIYKQRKLLATEIAKMAFEWELNDLAIKACEFVVLDEWETRNASEMILVQVDCYYILSQCSTDLLLKEGFEIAFIDAVQANDEEEEFEIEKTEISQEKKNEILATKRAIIDYYKKALKLAESIQQTWQIFNGSIYVWNNYLPIFRNPTNDPKLLPEISSLLKEFFDTMKNSLKELEKKQITDYDIDTKIQVFADVGLIYARLMEGKAQYEEVMKICESLLLTPLNPHTRKLINSIKARVSGVAKTSNKAPDKKSQQKEVNSSESVIFDVVSQLEIIQNSSNKSQTQDLIKKCFETLLAWKAKENDETELELHAELWARLARLALNQENSLMYKYSLRCVENSLSLLAANIDLQTVPTSRLRWYSLADYLYSETLARTLNPETQEIESQEKLLFHALKHAVESANKGLKASINSLVLDASKQVWNICSKLQDSAVNRKALIKPIFSTIFYLKSCKEKSEPDLVLLLSQLFFRAALENEEYNLGENVADMVCELTKKDLQKPVWEAKMIFLSKQGKNELQAISNMKEADATSQAKVWIRLARASNSTYKQSTAYNKAIEILKKENSIERVEVFIEYAEWMLRNNYPREEIEQTLLMSSDVLIEIERDEDDDDEDDEDEENADMGPPTLFSKSSKGKKSSISKNSKSKSRISMSKKSIKINQKSTKKTNEKSHMGSGMKSRSGSQNRMSRASIRAPKTIKKSKQAKSIFSQREEDPNPDYLNCSHFERLMRIHAMLALISMTQEQQIQYCLGATLFVTKIFEISFRTMNQFDQNREKYTKVNPNEKDNKDIAASQAFQTLTEMTSQLKYVLPTTLLEWIRLQFTKEFLEKVVKSEDFNFMSKFSFDRAEMTIKYLCEVIHILESYGLHVHTFPLYVLYRFLAKEILNSSYLALLADTQFAKMLYKLGFREDADQILGNSNLKKLKISEQDRKCLLNKSEAARLHLRSKPNPEIINETINRPLLIKETQVYKVWIELAKELIDFSEISRSRELLTYAEAHAKILFDIEAVAEIEYLNGVIFYKEGNYKASIEAHMRSHKIIKDLDLWERSSIETTRTLKKLKKISDVKKVFLNKMKNIIEELEEKSSFNYNFLALNHSLETIELLFMKTGLSEIAKEFSYEGFKQAMEHIEGPFTKAFTKAGMKLWHCELLLSSFFKTTKLLQIQNHCYAPKIEKSFRMLDKIIAVTLIIEEKLKGFLKYTMILEKDSSQNIQGPLNLAYAKAKIVLARCFSDQGILKQIMRSSDYEKSAGYALNLNSNLNLEDDPMINDKKGDTQHEQKHTKFSNYEPLNKFLEKITMKIERLAMPIPHRLGSFEKATAVLTSIIPRISQQNYAYYQAKIEQARSRRLLAESKRQMQEIWGQKNVENLEEDEEILTEEKLINIKIDYRLDSLNYLLDLKEHLPNNDHISNLFVDNQALYYSWLLALETLENFGLLHPETSFENLARYQHYQSVESLYNQILKPSTNPDFKPFLFYRLLKPLITQLHTSNADLISLMEGSKVFDLLNKGNISFKDIKEILPAGSAYLILQSSPDKRYMYLGFMYMNKERNTKFLVNRFKFTQQDYEKIQSFRVTLDGIKSSLIKTPIITDADLEKLEADNEKQYTQLLDEFEVFSNFFTKLLQPFINIEVKLDILEENKGQIPGKPGQNAKDAKKKPNKDELQNYENLLGSSPSGIETLTLLLDDELFDLPFERLEVFSKIPVICRDFSILIQAKRLNKVGYMTSSNNSSGFKRDSLKYVCYDFKQQENQDKLNAGPLIEENMKLLPTLKFEGVSSKMRIASLGEWQKYLNQGNFLLFYGHSSVLDIISPSLFCDMIEINNIKACLIFDRINARKAFIDKALPLDPEAEKVPIVQQPYKTIKLLSILGIQSIAINQWSVKPHEFCQSLDFAIKGIGEEIFFAAILNKYKLPQKVFVDPEGKIVDKKKVEEPVKKEKKPPQAGKGGKGAAASEEEKVVEENLTEITIEKKKIYRDNVIFFGLPNLRLV